MTTRNSRVLLGITGSVAAVKGPDLCLHLLDQGFDVKVLLTQGGSNFWSKADNYDPKSWQELQKKVKTGQVVIHCKLANHELFYAVEDIAMSHASYIQKAPDDEWEGWNRMGDPVLHVELRDWADAVVIAPLSAHTLAKLASGLCDDTLTCVLRAWDFGHHGERPAKYVVLAPAMNTAMWQHPLTQEQLQKIKSFSESGVVRIVPPMVKTLACGELGQGALAEVTKIVTELRAVLLPQLRACRHNSC